MRGVDWREACQSLSSGSPLPTIALMTQDSCVLYANPAFCKVMGKTGDALEGKAFSKVVPGGLECLAAIQQTFQSGRSAQHADALPPTAASPFGSYNVWPIHDQGVIVGVMLQLASAPAAHELAVALNEALIIGAVRQNELVERADRLNDQLVNANADLQQFAFAASHDLKEPLRNIKIFSELLIQSHESNLADEMEEHAKSMSDSIQRMHDMLVGLLLYVHASSGEKQSPRVVDLNQAVRVSLKNLEAAIAESAAIITADDLPFAVGHQGEFEQIFQNLISNAIKYRGEELPRVHISASKINDDWQIAVTDNGIGIPPEYRETIFRVFRRLHTQSIPGTGLGLSICRRIIERNGGRLWVGPGPVTGTTFYFTLPVKSHSVVPQPSLSSRH